MTVVPDASPFPGLRPFTEIDSTLFFGRTAAAHTLVAKWLENRLVVVYGPTGAGKSSLLQAGVLPQLSPKVAEVLPVGRISPVPVAAGLGVPPSSRAANPFAESVLRTWSGAGSTSTLPPVLRDRLGGRGPSPESRQQAADPNRPILAAVDQFEDFFAPGTSYLDPLREQFMTMLGEAVAALPNLRLLLVIRQNLRAHLAPYEAALAGGEGVARIRVGALDRRSAITAYAEPMRQAGLPLSPGSAVACIDELLRSRVVDAAGTTSVLTADAVPPAYLQLVAAALWRDMADRGVSLGPGTMEPTALVDTALGGHLTQVIVTEAERYDLDAGDVRRWLIRTFVTERGRRATVDEGIVTTAGMPNALLVALSERYVLASEWRSGSRRFELFDDRLIPPLQAAVPDWPVAGASAAEIGAVDYLQAALISLADGDLAAARVHVDEALRRDAEHPRTRAQAVMLRADLDDAQGRIEQAERGYRKAAQLYESLSDAESSGRALAAAGRLLLRVGRLSSAAEDLQSASARLPAELDVQTDLARALWYSGQRWAAAAIFSTVLTIAPLTPAALAGRGQLRVELGDDAAALDDLDRAVRLGSDSPDAADPGGPTDSGDTTEIRAARALALARLGRSATAAEETSAVLDDAPDSGPVLWRAAGVLRAIGDDTQAADLLERALLARAPALLAYQREQVHRMLRRPEAMA
ncbi:nSTAND1 domain-containing NTPase [Frankia tisae]|uniref:nSTAND1 domain-containing NTPase n=1 Tax=Frankia tisae TaxID=2950104 RepID=UPI0021C164E5|nr:tetratricopeptide repeat protein [Frankia tisae]